MKKKLVLSMLCAAMLTGGISAFAADTDKTVSVTVDRRSVCFADQEPVIEDGRTLVPLRDVFEAMSANVEWREEDRSVVINSYDNRTRLIIDIDNPELRKVTFLTVTDTEFERITSDVTPKIINDRAMIPLRIISENMDADVNWDEASYHVDIKTKQYKNALASLIADGLSEDEAIAEKAAVMTLDVDKTEVKAGDTVTVRINLSKSDLLGLDKITGASVAVLYDSDNFTYDGYKTYIGGSESPVYIAADNPDFKGNSAKVVYLFGVNDNYAPADGLFMELTFVAENDKGGEFALADRVTNVGYDTYLAGTKNGKSAAITSATEFTIDTTAAVVKGAVDTSSDEAEKSNVTQTVVTKETDEKTTTENKTSTAVSSGGNSSSTSKSDSDASVSDVSDSDEDLASAEANEDGNTASSDGITPTPTPTTDDGVQPDDNAETVVVPLEIED